MRILYLALAPPLPANNGQRIRTSLVLRALKEEGHDVTLLAFATESLAPAQENELRRLCCQVELIPHELHNLSSPSGYLGRLKALAAREPYSAARFRSDGMRSRIREHIATQAWDVIICDTVFGAVNVPEDSPPLIVNNQNVEHVILERYLPFERNPLRRHYAQMEIRSVRQWERAVYSRAAAAMVCSEVDGEQLRRLCPGLPTHVVPNVVDVDQYKSRNGTEDPATILYVGGMDWYPNRDAVDFFLRDIFPRIRTEVPEATFLIAGRSPRGVLASKLNRRPGVKVIGTVPDMRPVLEKATVCVVPLRIGSGTRVKILEAAAMRKPVVATCVAAEGLDFRDEDEILRADTSDGIVMQILFLLRNPSARLRMGSAARCRVEKQYSFPALKRALSSALRELDAEEAPAPRISDSLEPMHTREVP